MVWPLKGKRNLPENLHLPGFEEPKDEDELRPFRRRPRPKLHLVDRVEGEIVDCPNCREYQKQLDGAERDIRAWRSRYASLKADLDREAREHELFPQVASLFNMWRIDCGHDRSAFTPERFWMALPHVETYGADLCRLAIAGAAHDPYETTRKNGTVKRHDGWDIIFRSSEKLEEFACRAPRELIAQSRWEIVDGKWKFTAPVNAVPDTGYASRDESTDGPAEASGGN